MRGAALRYENCHVDSSRCRCERLQQRLRYDSPAAVRDRHSPGRAIIICHAERYPVRKLSQFGRRLGLVPFVPPNVASFPSPCISLTPAGAGAAPRRWEPLQNTIAFFHRSVREPRLCGRTVDEEEKRDVFVSVSFREFIVCNTPGHTRQRIFDCFSNRKKL